MATPKPILPAEQFYDLSFPLAGINNMGAFSDAKPQQMPNGEFGRTAQDALNVRSFETQTQRGRGGSRPGLTKYIATPLVAGWIVQDLNSVVYTSAGAL